MRNLHSIIRRSKWLLLLILLLVLMPPGLSRAGVMVCMIQLEHADAEYLASVLEPFLSPEGTITPHRSTNTLIIKDREQVVNMLAEIIKGRPCIPVSQPYPLNISPHP